MPHSPQKVSEKVLTGEIPFFPPERLTIAYIFAPTEGVLETNSPQNNAQGEFHQLAPCQRQLLKGGRCLVLIIGGRVQRQYP